MKKGIMKAMVGWETRLHKSGEMFGINAITVRGAFYFIHTNPTAYVEKDICLLMKKWILVYALE